MIRFPAFRKVAAWIAVGVAAGWLLSLISVVVWGRWDRAKPADAIVVLGAAQYVGRPSPVLRARLDHALILWRKGIAPFLVLTGGVGIGDTLSEAAAGRLYMLKEGVPDSVLFLESKGRTTNESLRLVATMMHARGLDRSVLVSDPFHMLRLAVVARRVGLIGYTSPTATSPISASRIKAWQYILSESVKAPLALFLQVAGS